MKITITLILFFLSSHHILSRRYYPGGYFSRNQVSAGSGFSSYFGDLREKGYFTTDMQFMLSYEHQLSQRISVKAEGVYYRLKGNDANSADPGRVSRNLSFHSSNLELSSSLVLYLFRKIPVEYTQRPFLNFYGQIGFGGTSYNPMTYYQGKTWSLRDYKTEGVAYSRFAALIPVGLGVQVRLTENIDISAETTYRYVFSDYLDDVSTVYPGEGSFSSETAAGLSDRRPAPGKEPAAAGSQRGNPGVKDGYGLYTLKVSWYLESFYFRARDRNKKWAR